MIQRITRSLIALSLLASFASTTQAYPEPSKFPISWELKFEYKTPRRIVIEVPGAAAPKAYWYMTYTVTNKTDQEREFLPYFEMVTRTGKIIRSDKNMSPAVFERIKAVAGIPLLESPLKIGGTLRVGEDQAKDGVAIWEETEAEMGDFSIFVSGLSGESTQLTDSSNQPALDKDGKPIILFKTMQIDYKIAGDEVLPGNDPITKTNQKWVMR